MKLIMSLVLGIALASCGREESPRTLATSANHGDEYAAELEEGDLPADFDQMSPEEQLQILDSLVNEEIANDGLSLSATTIVFNNSQVKIKSKEKTKKNGVTKKVVTVKDKYSGCKTKEVSKSNGNYKFKTVCK